MSEAGKSLHGKRVLVTGANGFVGSWLAKRLSGLGCETLGTVRRNGSSENVESLRASGVKIVEADVRNLADLKDAVRDVEVVFHIAALFRQAKHNEQVYWDINVEGVRNVIDASIAAGVKRLVHCSTVGVHSHIPNPPADETEEYRPGDIYQETKCEGEKLAKEKFSQGSIEGAIIRPAMIWGEGDRRMLKLYRNVARRRFPIIGTGKVLTHWIYVHDLVNGFLLAAEKPEAINQTYIIAGEKPVPLEELVAAVAKVAGVKPLPFKIPARPVQELGSLCELVCQPFGIEPPIYRRRVDFFTKTRAFDWSKASRELGYQPQQSFQQEVEAIFKWYRSQGWID